MNKLTTHGNIKPTRALHHKLSSLSSKIQASSFHANLMKNKHEQIAKISISHPIGFFTAKQSMHSLYDSIDLVSTKLIRQLAKEKTKVKRNRRRNGLNKEAHLEEWIAYTEEDEE